MDAAETPSLRRLLVRGAATLLALAGLYLLGVGPAIYVAEKYPPSQTFVGELYEPLFWVASRTPLATPLNPYVEWWLTLARQRGHPG